MPASASALDFIYLFIYGKAAAAGQVWFLSHDRLRGNKRCTVALSCNRGTMRRIRVTLPKWLPVVFFLGAIKPEATGEDNSSDGYASVRYGDRKHSTLG